MWGCGRLDSRQVNVILPADGGQIIDATTEFDERGFPYPGEWEAQLAILQGEQGGFFVSSTDTTFRFKEVRYMRSTEHFGISFKTDNFAPFRDKNEITSVEWRLNAYRGDWQIPALYYRNWMEIAFQPKQPLAWLQDIELVIIYPGLKKEILPLLAAHLNPSTTLLYLQDWRKAGWDTNYPDYIPKPEFGDFVEAAHAYGFRVMPHANLLGCSPNHPRYPEFEKYQLRHAIGGNKLGWRWDDLTHP